MVELKLCRTQLSGGGLARRAALRTRRSMSGSSWKPPVSLEPKNPQVEQPGAKSFHGGTTGAFAPDRLERLSYYATIKGIVNPGGGYEMSG